MTKVIAILLLAYPLGGCAAAIAASAASMAVRGVQGTPQSNRHLQPAAREACSAHAGQYGAVHIIDVEQRNVGRIVVWGTVTDATERRSFQCRFTDRITRFTLRGIK
ncbi:MAG TPA: hypothetical protein VMK31_04820 [Sphingomicrobium sp.]|nr:hypothetical protein [Sphingomicrobium sp.]